MPHTPAACYRALGLPEGAGPEAIRRAYRQLAHEMHPDLHPGDRDLAQRFVEITAAYNHLSGRALLSELPTPRCAFTPTPQAPEEAARAWAAWRRRAAQVRDGLEGEGAEATEPTDPAPPPQEVEPRAEIEPQAELAPRARRWRRSIAWLLDRAGLGRRGRDVEMPLPIDPASVGAEVRIAISRVAACPAAGAHPSECVCHGARRLTVRERVKVFIPTEARVGTRLRLAGKGTEGLDGHPPGDLYLRLVAPASEG